MDNKIEQKSDLKIKYLKNIFAVVLAFASFFGINFFEKIGFSESGFDEDASYSEEIVFDFEGETEVFGSSEFDSSFLRFSSENAEIEGKRLGNDRFSFVVKKADFWGNFSFSAMKANLFLDRIVLIPENASFNLEFDGESVLLEVYEGDVYVAFVKEKTSFETVENQFFDPYSEDLLNRILVPKGNQVVIPLSKLDLDLDQLFYSKLVKEFKYSTIPAVKWDSTWVSENLKRDKEVLQYKRSEFSKKYLDFTPNPDVGPLDGFVVVLKENLTLFASKKEEIAIAAAIGHLEKALYYANLEDRLNMRLCLDAFLADAVKVSDEDFWLEVNEIRNSLFIFSKSNLQFEILESLVLLDQNSGKRALLDLYWENVYLDLSAFENYYAELEKFLLIEHDSEFLGNFLNFQNQLVDNLLLKYPDFYREEIFVTKSVLEKQLLDNYQDDLEYWSELQQSFINGKLNFLKKLRIYTLEGDLELETAEDLFSLLFEEIYNLRQQAVADLAVEEYFQSELESFVDFWGFLRDDDFHGQNGVGDLQRLFETYLLEREKIVSYSDLEFGILGISSENGGLEKSVEDLENLFDKKGKTERAEVLNFQSLGQRFVSMKVIYKGFVFQFVYDRDREVIRDLEIFDDSIEDYLTSDFLDFQDSLGTEIEFPLDFSIVLDSLESQYKNQDLEQFSEDWAKAKIIEELALADFEVVSGDILPTDHRNAEYLVEIEDFDQIFDYQKGYRDGVDYRLELKIDLYDFQVEELLLKADDDDLVKADALEFSNLASFLKDSGFQKIVEQKVGR